MKLHCFEIMMSKQLPEAVPEVVVAFGDDPFLRRETVTSLLALSGIDPETCRTYDGEEASWMDVHDELATLSLFDADARRVAIVPNGDKLIKDSRPLLEKWFGAPANASLLILQPGSFPGNTKLAKLAAQKGWVVECSLPTGGGRSKSPNAAEIQKWILAWGKQRHDLKLSKPQATLILDAVGPMAGLIHQELAKLALYAADNGTLTDDSIRSHIGSWRTRTMWEIADAIADGRTTDALEQLERVFSAGEHPAAVIPQIAWSLRRFGNAAHLILQAKRHGGSMSAQAAIGQCGFWGKDAQLAEGRLRRMGLRRASSLLPWLLELDLKIKGSHSSPSRARFALEELCLRFSS